MMPEHKSPSASLDLLPTGSSGPYGGRSATGAEVGLGSLDQPCLPGPVLVGVSLQAGAPTGGHEAAFRFSTPEALAGIKKSRKELCELLQRLPAQPHFREGFVWNTCQRTEFYGWVRSPDSPAARELAAARVARELFGEPRPGLHVNQLDGCDVWYHLMRTACGLNSCLPGDLDVTAQLETAVHIARSAGAAGSRASALLARVLRVAESVSRLTEWGTFRTGYCQAALGQLQDPAASSWTAASHVVIGGSTTSRAIIDTLVRHYHVPQDRITLVYRGHHGQWKLLRDALGTGRRLRVQAYTDPVIAQAVTAADVVFFGLDVAAPVLAQATLRGLRDFRKRPLLLVDFNSFGSVGDSEPARGITLLGASRLEAAVERYAADLRRRPDFCRAAEEADRWIRNRGVPQGASSAPRLASA